MMRVGRNLDVTLQYYMFMSASSSSSGSTSISCSLPLARALRFLAEGRTFFFGLVSAVGFRPDMWSTISTDDCLSANRDHESSPYSVSESQACPQ